MNLINKLPTYLQTYCHCNAGHIICVFYNYSIKVALLVVHHIFCVLNVTEHCVYLQDNIAATNNLPIMVVVRFLVVYHIFCDLKVLINTHIDSIKLYYLHIVKKETPHHKHY